MRKKAAIALACLFANAVFAQETQLRLDSPRYNFGKVLAGTIIRHDFTFTNAGSRTLEISSVEPSCECVTVEDWSRTVEPGQTGRIRAKMDTSKVGTGLLLRAVTFSSNTAEKQQGVMLFGEVWNEIDVETDGIALEEVVLHVGADQTNASRVLSLTNHLDAPVEVLRVTADKPDAFAGLALAVSLKTNQVGTSYQVEVDAAVPLEIHHSTGQIQILTSSTNKPVIKIQAFIIRDR